MRSMWRGNLVNVIKITPESAIKFFAWDAAKQFVYRNPDVTQVTMVERLTAGSIAGVTAQISIFPMEVIKVRRRGGDSGVLGPADDAGSPARFAPLCPTSPTCLSPLFSVPTDPARNWRHWAVQGYYGLCPANYPWRGVSETLSRVCRLEAPGCGGCPPGFAQACLAARLPSTSHCLPSTHARLTPALLGVVPYAGIDLAVHETLKTVCVSLSS